jgi:hypothetical protein
MNSRKSSRMLVGLALIALLLSGCGPSAPPETRAGEWKATTDFGEFTFTVDPSGTTITSIEYSFQSCSDAIISGSVTFSGTIDLGEGLPIENGKFTLEVGGVTSMEFDGKFSRDGTRASGSWTAGACSGKWTSTR